MLVFGQFGDITRHRHKPNRNMIDLAYEDPSDSRVAIDQMRGVPFPPPKNWNLRLNRNWPTCNITVEEGRPITESQSGGATASKRSAPIERASRAAASHIKRSTDPKVSVIRVDARSKDRSKGSQSQSPPRYQQSPSRYSPLSPAQRERVNLEPAQRERGQKRSSSQFERGGSRSRGGFKLIPRRDVEEQDYKRRREDR